MPISELLLPEFDEEMKKTRTMIGRVPVGRLVHQCRDRNLESLQDL